MISSPSAQIVNAIAESHQIRTSEGKLASAYGPTMGIATAIIAIGIAVTTAFGPEKRGRHFETVGPPVAYVEKDIEQGSTMGETRGSVVKETQDMKQTEVTERI